MQPCSLGLPLCARLPTFAYGSDELNPEPIALRSVFGFKLALVFGGDASPRAEIVNYLRPETEPLKTKAVRTHREVGDLVIRKLSNVEALDTEEDVGH